MSKGGWLRDAPSGWGGGVPVVSQYAFPEWGWAEGGVPVVWVTRTTTMIPFSGATTPVSPSVAYRGAHHIGPGGHGDGDWQVPAIGFSSVFVSPRSYGSRHGASRLLVSRFLKEPLHVFGVKEVAREGYTRGVASMVYPDTIQSCLLGDRPAATEASLTSTGGGDEEGEESKDGGAGGGGMETSSLDSSGRSRGMSTSGASSASAMLQADWHSHLFFKMPKARYCTYGNLFTVGRSRVNRSVAAGDWLIGYLNMEAQSTSRSWKPSIATWSKCPRGVVYCLYLLAHEPDRNPFSYRDVMYDPVELGDMPWLVACVVFAFDTKTVDDMVRNLMSAGSLPPLVRDGSAEGVALAQTLGSSNRRHIVMDTVLAVDQNLKEAFKFATTFEAAIQRISEGE